MHRKKILSILYRKKSGFMLNRVVTVGTHLLLRVAHTYNMYRHDKIKLYMALCFFQFDCAAITLTNPPTPPTGVKLLAVLLVRFLTLTLLHHTTTHITTKQPLNTA